MSVEVPSVVAVLIVALVIFPFTLIALFLFYQTLDRSYEDWSQMRGLGEISGWLVLLLFKVGGLVMYAWLVYFTLTVLF